MRCSPGDLARRKLEQHATASSGIGFHRGPEGRSPARTLDLLPTEIGHTNVFAIHGRPPLRAAELTALPYPGLPQDLAVTVRINRVHQTRLLAGNQRTPPGWQTHKDGSRPEVEIGSASFGTVRAAVLTGQMIGIACLRPFGAWVASEGFGGEETPRGPEAQPSSERRPAPAIRILPTTQLLLAD
jgi:hypothetical protein